MTKTLSLSLFSCYRSELMGIAMIGVLIAYFIGLGGTIFGPHGMATSIGIDKIPIFLLGVYAGQISFNHRKKEGFVLLVAVGIVWIVTLFLKETWPYGISLYGIAEKVVYMFFICLVLSLVENWRVIKWIRLFLVWFGKYSLELYVLHLLIFCFISSKMLFGNIAPIVKVVIMVTGALILCVPFQKLIKNIVGKIKFNNQ